MKSIWSICFVIDGERRNMVTRMAVTPASFQNTSRTVTEIDCILRCSTPSHRASEMKKANKEPHVLVYYY